MIERVIENWLINTNERNYQIPFCQVLISQGHEILSISTHGRLEFGKDIISRDQSGTIHCYQLKTGNITLGVWNKIYSQINDLINMPCDYPGVDKKIPHVSHLVTNGIIKEDVSQRVDKLNSTKTNFSKLEIIDLNQLLPQFIDAQGKFMPKDLKNFQEFLTLFLFNGKNFFPKEQFFNFLFTSIFKEYKVGADKRNSIISSLLITSYCLNNFQKENNHFAKFEAWATLKSAIYHYSIKYSLTDKCIDKSLELIDFEIKNSLKELEDEFLSRKNYLEGGLLGDGKEVYNARLTIMLGTLALKEVFVEQEKSKELVEIIRRELPKIYVWGESAVPYIFMIIKFLEKNDEDVLSQKLLTSVLNAFILANSPRKSGGLLYPYYSPEECLLHVFGMSPETIRISTSGSAYFINDLIEMCVRRNLKKYLQSRWRLITHIQNNVFIPKSSEDYFYFLNKGGANNSYFQNQTEKWADLVSKSKKSSLPSELLEFKSFFPEFILIFPHRANSGFLKEIDLSLT